MASVVHLRLLIIIILIVQEILVIWHAVVIILYDVINLHHQVLKSFLICYVGNVEVYQTKIVYHSN